MGGYSYYDKRVCGFTDQRSSTATTRRQSFTPSSMRSSSWTWSLTPTHRRSSSSAPTPPSNLLEVIWLDLVDTELVIHAMELRPKFYDLLPTGEDPTP